MKVFLSVKKKNKASMIPEKTASYWWM